MPTFSNLKAPTSGTAITRKGGRLVVPADPIVPFIEGDGTGPDIWRASVRVFDAAVEKAYAGKKRIVSEDFAVFPIDDHGDVDASEDVRQSLPVEAAERVLRSSPR